MRPFTEGAKGVSALKYCRGLSVFVILCILAAVSGICPAIADATAKKHTITFDVRGIGETPDPITVNDGECYLYLRENGANNPTAEGYQFRCWVTTLDFEPDEVSMSNTAAYLETPIHEDMTLYAVWMKVIDHIEVEVDPPADGDVITRQSYYYDGIVSHYYQWPYPEVRAVSEGICINDRFFSPICPAAYWLADPSDLGSTFTGTFVKGKDYGVSIEVVPQFGYEFADQLTVTFNGKSSGKKYYPDYNLCIVSEPIRCVEKVFLLGDIDADGDVAATDAAFLQRKLSGIEIPFAIRDDVADVDGDDEITLTDATLIQKWLAEMSPDQPIGKPVAG